MTMLMRTVITGFAALLAVASPSGAETRSAVFAGGCFWCVEKDFDHVAGVVATTSGYSGGMLANPTYRNHEGHREVVKVDYDPSVTNYATLVKIFLRSVDPTDAGGQFCDRGHAYTTAIYVADDAERQAAEAATSQAATVLGVSVVTPVEAAGVFWPAEDYHQDYYKKNPLRYAYYRNACGRDDRVSAVWGAAAHEGIEGY